VAGIFLGSKFNLPLAFVFIGLIPFSLLLFLRQHRKLIILTSLCLIALFGSASYFQSSLPVVNENYLQFYNDQGTVEIRGMVNADPEIRDKSTHLRLSAKEIKLDQASAAISLGQHLPMRIITLRCGEEVVLAQALISLN